MEGMDRHKQQDGRPKEVFHRETLSPTLSDLGINRLQSHRWQLMSGIPEVDFEEHIEHTLSVPEELTSSGVVRLAKQLLAAEEAETPPLPEGIYNVIYADPPWQIAKQRRTHASFFLIRFVGDQSGVFSQSRRLPLVPPQS